ncbi:MAG: DMT family transporter [bacterium]|nr:DMT family transporter [bacterium]
MATDTGSSETHHASGGFELIIGALLIAFIWGITQPVIKGAYAGLSPFALIWMRSVLSALTLTVWMGFAKREDRTTHPDRRHEVFHRILNGLLHNAHILFLYVGMTSTLAARASVLLYTQPIWVMLIAAAALPGERITAIRALGFIVAMAGTVTVFFDRLAGEGALWAESFILLSAVIWCVQTIHFRKYLGRSDVVAVTRWAMLIGAPLYLALTWLWEGGGRYVFGFAEVFAILFMGLLSSGLFLVYWAYLLMKYSPPKVSVFFFLCPVFGVGGSALALGERIGWPLLAGGALIVCGVWFVTNEERFRRKRAAAHPSLQA